MDCGWFRKSLRKGDILPNLRPDQTSDRCVGWKLSDRHDCCFSGFTEAKHLEEGSENNRFKFAIFYADEASSPDPIRIFRAAEYQVLTKEFIQFILSLNRRKLLDFNWHTQGGPGKVPMRPTPILKTIYDAQYNQYRYSPYINHYKFAALFIFHKEWTNGLSNIMDPLVKLAFIGAHHELSNAMQSIIRAGKEGRVE
jgi:hypothetical protein